VEEKIYPVIDFPPTVAWDMGELGQQPAATQSDVAGDRSGEGDVPCLWLTARAPLCALGVHPIPYREALRDLLQAKPEPKQPKKTAKRSRKVAKSTSGT
jgi:hypothetical protein